ncbi:MAG: hypothetical protein K8T91_01890 [Planctomycetes bacterium]|nr:hypothetical protein [Planctomycetota bacterium]
MKKELTERDLKAKWTELRSLRRTYKLASWGGVALVGFVGFSAFVFAAVFLEFHADHPRILFGFVLSIMCIVGIVMVWSMFRFANWKCPRCNRCFVIWRSPWSKKSSACSYCALPEGAELAEVDEPLPPDLQ